MKRIIKIVSLTLMAFLIIAVVLIFTYLVIQDIKGNPVPTLQEYLVELAHRPSTEGNGFGGEEGMVVIETGYHSRSDYFWLDKDNLAFYAGGLGHAYDNKNNFVFNARTKMVKPIDLIGRVGCYRNGKLLFSVYSESDIQDNGLRNKKLHLGKIEEEADKWILKNVKPIADIWPMPDERHKLSLSNCNPVAIVKKNMWQENDIPHRNYILLSEWGMVVQFPRTSSKSHVGDKSHLGYFHLNSKIYNGSLGPKVRDLSLHEKNKELPINYVYLKDLDKYWFGPTRVRTNEKMEEMGFLQPSTETTQVSWSKKWKQYISMPLPTRKGFVWAGEDYRKNKANRKGMAAYFQDNSGVVHTIVNGIATRLKINDDRCRVAFFYTNNPYGRKQKAGLKIFDACASTVNDKEMEDVEY